MKTSNNISIENKDIDRIDNYRKKYNTSVLTILFTDIESSTKFREELGDKGYTELLDKHDEILLPIVSDYRGLHIKSIGDSILAVFFQPSDAVECAISIQDSIFNSPLIKPFLKVRIGIDMGQVAKEQAGGIIKDIFGRFVNRAARIEGLANGNHILCSESVQDNATGWIDTTNIKWFDHGLHHVKGLEKPLKIWEPFNANITEPDTFSKKIIGTIQQQELTNKPLYCLRNEKINVSDENFEKIFNLNELWRPKQYIENDFIDNGDNTITDKTTGLMWKKSGSPNRMPLSEIEQYLKEINNAKFAGYTDWRIPTIDELTSLIEPEIQANKLHINSLFDSKERFWSCDNWVSNGGWSVNFKSNLVYCRASSKKGHVRLVRSLIAQKNFNPTKINKTAIISDIHGNINGLIAVIEDIKKNNCDRIVCLGDLIEGGKSNVEVVRFVKDNQIVCISGNHDESNDLILPEDVNDFLKNLSKNFVESDIIFTHVSPRPKKKKVKDEIEAWNVLSEVNYRLSFIGHSHTSFIFGEQNEFSCIAKKHYFEYGKPFEFNKNDKYIISVGPIGYSRDEIDKPRYGIYDHINDNIEIRIVDGELLSL